MNVQVHVKFRSPGPDESTSMASLARALASDPDSIQVLAGAKPGWLVAQFTMPTEPQHQAVNKIDREMRFCIGDRLDSMIGFPKSPAEQASADRKNARRRAKRREKRHLE